MGQESEDHQKLWTENSSRARVVVLGAANLMKPWPARGELLTAILAGCILTTALALLALVPIIVAYGPGNACKLMRKNPYRALDNGAKSASVYFLKHENRTWTGKELCYVETAARLHPDYNIILINLLRKGPPAARDKLNANFFDQLWEYCTLSERKLASIGRNGEENNAESKMRYQLSAIPNVVNIDVGVEQFFAGSIISKKIVKLSRDELELAAKFQAIWSSPGIALEPLNVHQLESVRHIFNKSQTDPLTGIQIENDLQASSVACQSFVGLVMSEIAKGDHLPDRQTILMNALINFYLSFRKWTGVQAVEPIFTWLRNFTDCPIIESMIDAGGDVDEKKNDLKV